MNDIAISDDGHPESRILRAFAEGKLEENLIDEVSSHVSECDECLAKIQGFAKESDTLLEGLREVGSSSGNFEVAQADAPSADAMRDAIESQSKYRVIEQLGSGGMGSVYLAEHLVMDRKVAIKVIRKEFVANPEAVLRFKNEVRNAARLAHRNIVTAHDAEQVNDIHFLVMEHVPGESLTQLVRRKGPLPVKHACNFALQVAHGLNHAFEHQMVHRDIKPANLMRTPRGVIKILDFGLARVMDADDNSAITTTGIMMGTADYIAPEQARDAKTADIRSDLYSLGCTLYFLLTGKPPFRADTKVDKIMAHCSTEFPDVSEQRDDIPDNLVLIIKKLTQKDPADRYQTPRELIDDLTPLGKAKPNDPVAVDSQAQSKFSETDVADTRFDSKTSAAFSKTSIDEKTSNGRPQPAAWKPVALMFGALCMLIPLVWFLISAMGDWAKESENKGGGAGKQSRRTVLLVMSSRNFWFSDYKPIERIMAENDIDLIVTADQKGSAQFNPIALDSAPNKHSVEIEKSVSQLVDEEVYKDVDAVVFIGTDTSEFRQQNRIGQNVRKLLQELRDRNKWITSVGKGSEVPLYYGFYNGVEVCESEYIEASAQRNSGAVMVQERVHLVKGSKVLTCSMWDDAEAFAKKLVEVLKE